MVPLPVGNVQERYPGSPDWETAGMGTQTNLDGNPGPPKKLQGSRPRLIGGGGQADTQKPQEMEVCHGQGYVHSSRGVALGYHVYCLCREFDPMY
jgi:hypothetical protein